MTHITSPATVTATSLLASLSTSFAPTSTVSLFTGLSQPPVRARLSDTFNWQQTITDMVKDVNVNQGATSKMLCTIVQQTDERFSIALVEIPKCDDIVALFVLKRGLLSRLSFLDEICIWKPRTIAKALGRARGMIEVEGFWRTAKLERLNHSRREQYQGDENDSGQRPTSPSQDESYDMNEATSPANDSMATHLTSLACDSRV
ncbi:hypothetical protein TIFTF001_046056 [Ficus carica]|uniref:Uncharacterized protein n=1 Tax=Ficus carica TaxID=3494 RepID=A0AA87Z898_FICCA|nr:hypothetical protein TIFTF001_046050 [Ficus carica]GMN26419.1 hypothetical protein TIFTF001_046052 [Ficus carica]GMN26445.1 hypothetical protein TIFTF001_046054 [Ficus carica]GMN26458.1 hypothetical protein TIFTF001_046056 [Ficus carica]